MGTANLSNVFHLGRNNEFKRWLLILFRILLDFLLTVKAATLIFISGRGSAKKGNQVLFIRVSLLIKS